MKTPLALFVVVLVGIAAFLLGSEKFVGKKLAGVEEINTRTTAAMPATAASETVNPAPGQRTGQGVLTTGMAAKMTPEERVALLKKAALLADAGKQSDILCGLISAMTQEELVESTQVLLDAQNKGSNWSQEVWNALWTQWGRVAAVACLELSTQSSNNNSWNGFKGLNTTNDYRCLMAGWLETNPEEAMAWAKLDKLDIRSAVGAAYAITKSADGDLGKMESAILGIAGNKLTAQACFEDYFDLAALAADKPSPAALYDQMTPALQAVAWTAVIERIAQTSPDKAAAWLESHADDPGYDARPAYQLIQTMVQKDPETTVQWAVGLPTTGNQTHPAVVAIESWVRRDPEAASTWLKTQPSDAPWVKELSRRPDSTDPFAN